MKMDFKKIFNGEATIEELSEMNRQGYEFVIESGKITKIIKDDKVVESVIVNG